MIGACKRAWRYYYVALALSWTVSYAYPSEVEQFRFRYLREFVYDDVYNRNGSWFSLFFLRVELLPGPVDAMF